MPISKSVRLGGSTSRRLGNAAAYLPSSNRLASQSQEGKATLKACAELERVQPAVRRINGACNKSLPKQKLRVEVLSDDPGLHLFIHKALADLPNGGELEMEVKGALTLPFQDTSQPDAVLMDLGMTHLSDFQRVRKLRAIKPGVHVIVLVARSDGSDILSFLLAGACGYLIKPFSGSELLAAVENAIEGRLALSAAAERLLLGSLHRAGTRSLSLQLTPREEQVLSFVVGTEPDKAIAEALGISHGTVHVHLANIFKKLGAHSRDEALTKFLGVEAPSC